MGTGQGLRVRARGGRGQTSTVGLFRGFRTKTPRETDSAGFFIGAPAAS